jgi:outer membrane protein assembly factor BamC
MRAGTQRWLAIDLPPEEVFPKLKEFWRSQGLDLEREDAAVGIAETVWAENTAKLPLDFIRRTVGRVFDGMYSTSELDKYRSRVERTPSNTSEVYVSHRGLVEVFTSSEQDRTRWQTRGSDAQLEAEMLQRLLLTFLPPVPAEKAAAVVAAATAPAAPPVARVVKGGDGAATLVQINEPFDRAWRRVGLALDRGGFTVEDRDRVKGLYFVRYLDPDYEAKKREEQGILTRWFGRESKVDAQQFRVQVQGRGDGTQVTVLDKDGQPENSATGAKILAQISEQLR